MAATSDGATASGIDELAAHTARVAIDVDEPHRLIARLEDLSRLARFSRRDRR